MAIGNSDIHYKRIPIEDGTEVEIQKYFAEAFHWINTHLENGRKVLVHCKQGRSRSCAIVISFLMQKEKIRFSTAHQIVSQARPLISLNSGFIRRLEDFEKEIILPNHETIDQKTNLPSDQKSNLPPDHEKSSLQDHEDINLLSCINSQEPSPLSTKKRSASSQLQEMIQQAIQVEK